jgi:hypothetical protein
MRRFSSYGPVSPKLHYYAPRTELVERASIQLVGEASEEGGHYITVWAPRQTGKTWVMQQVVSRLQARGDFEVAILTLQSARTETTAAGALDLLVSGLRRWFGRDLPAVTSWKGLGELFTANYFARPLILILDEFDSLPEEFIADFANEFRSMYTQRLNEADKKSGEKSCLLHGLALVGVRAVLGVENVRGSPFNVQRSLHIPNLTFDEVAGMFRWYEQESGQAVESAVVTRLFEETRGQPGLVGWFGELLTETYNTEPKWPITLDHFEEVYAEAINVLPNNNILNLVSKARQEPYREFVLELFETRTKVEFSYDDVRINFLYMNGVIDREKAARGEYYVKFASPFVQKRLFNYFAGQAFRELGRLYPLFADLSDTITDDQLHVRNLLRRYEQYLRQNRDWLLKDAPRKSDLRICEAVYHFNLYLYLASFIRHRRGEVWPEFPTGNGKLDLLIRYAGRLYGIEVKSYSDDYAYRQALQQAARYGQQLGLTEIVLALFVEQVDDANRARYEAVYTDVVTGVTVTPVFVETG